jgi:hypothetical protein
MVSLSRFEECGPARHRLGYPRHLGVKISLRTGSSETLA